MLLSLQEKMIEVNALFLERVAAFDIAPYAVLTTFRKYEGQEIDPVLCTSLYIESQMLWVFLSQTSTILNDSLALVYFLRFLYSDRGERYRLWFAVLSPTIEISEQMTANYERWLAEDPLHIYNLWESYQKTYRQSHPSITPTAELSAIFNPKQQTAEVLSFREEEEEPCFVFSWSAPTKCPGS